MLGWLPCALLCALTAFTVRADEVNALRVDEVAGDAELHPMLSTHSGDVDAAIQKSTSAAVHRGAAASKLKLLADGCVDTFF